MAITAHTQKHRTGFLPWERAVLVLAGLVVLVGVVWTAQYMTGSGQHVLNVYYDAATVTNLALLARLSRQLRRDA